MTGNVPDVLAHGVGRVYESPIPIEAYLVGAAATVLASFAARIFVTTRPGPPREHRIAGRGPARAVALSLRALGIIGLALTLASGVIVAGRGSSLAPLLFWVGLIVGAVLLGALLEGAWAAADPWLALENAYRIEGVSTRHLTPPWWLGPVLLYGLFWFELVSGSGFDDFGIVFVLVVYSLFCFGLRRSFGDDWRIADPLSILFGFAERIAPLELREEGIYARSPLTRLDQPQPMHLSLSVAVFVVLASTTLDNIRETVGWTTFLGDVGLADISSRVVDSVALIAFVGLFAAPFIAAIAVARRWLDGGETLATSARHFGWSLIPIGVAYLLAHNAPLLISGVPEIVRGLADPFGFGWNLLGAGNWFGSYAPSPRLIWFVEIALIVGGHILGVLTAHRIALRLSDAPRNAVRSQYPLMLLMTIYTVATLWLLSQPLVV